MYKIYDAELMFLNNKQKKTHKKLINGKLNEHHKLPCFYEIFNEMPVNYFDALVETGVLSKKNSVPLGIVKHWLESSKKLNINDWLAAVTNFKADVSLLNSQEYVQKFNEFVKV